MRSPATSRIIVPMSSHDHSEARQPPTRHGSWSGAQTSPTGRHTIRGSHGPTAEAGRDAPAGKATPCSREETVRHVKEEVLEGRTRQGSPGCVAMDLCLDRVPLIFTSYRGPTNTPGRSAGQDSFEGYLDDTTLKTASGFGHSPRMGSVGHSTTGTETSPHTLDFLGNTRGRHSKAGQSRGVQD